MYDGNGLLVHYQINLLGQKPTDVSQSKKCPYQQQQRHQASMAPSFYRYLFIYLLYYQTRTRSTQ